MARQKEFDRDRALDGAIQVFWRHGFEGTTTGMLVDGMRIGRQSLYDTFGDKRRLYLEALRRYNDARIGGIVAQLKEAPSPLAGIEAVLDALVTLPEAERALGCFGVNATCEHGTADAEVIGVTEASRVRLNHALEQAVRAAQDTGEIDPVLAPADILAFLHTIMAGLKVMGRGGADSRALRAALAIGVRRLDP